MTVVMALGVERIANSMLSLDPKWDPVTKHFILESSILPLNCISMDDVHSEQSWFDSCIYSAFLSLKLISQFSISYNGTSSIWKFSHKNMITGHVILSRCPSGTCPSEWNSEVIDEFIQAFGKRGFLLIRVPLHPHYRHCCISQMTHLSLTSLSQYFTYISLKM